MANDEELMRAAKKLDKIAIRKDTSVCKKEFSK